MAHMDDVSTKRANGSYIRSVMGESMLGREQELDLARRWKDKGDEKAMHELVRAYARLVVAAATRFRHYGLPIGDLIQEGNIGLMQAVGKFDPERNVRFSTYANWWVRAAIQDYVLRNWSIVRTGTTAAHKSLFFNLKRLKAKIGNDNNGDDARKKIAKELMVTDRDVETMENRLSGRDHSLNAPVGEDSADEWQSLLADDRPNPEEVVIGMKDAESRSLWLQEALAKLTDRERRIVSERHLSEDVVTLDDLGRELGISKERVRQLESRAMEKLKTSLGSHAAEMAGAF